MLILAPYEQQFRAQNRCLSEKVKTILEGEEPFSPGR
jgi:hypothetical protein